MTKSGSSALTVRDMVLFAMLGALMFVSKIIMEWIPNIHLLGMFTITYTIVYRKKALWPIYIFVLLSGITYGFASWWLSYLYIWTVLWGVTMLLPQNMSRKTARIVYMIVCALHGLFFGTLFAPLQALLYGFSLSATVTWVIAGLPWDAIHAVGNFFAGILIIPLSQVLIRLDKNTLTHKKDI